MGRSVAVGRGHRWGCDTRRHCRQPRRSCPTVRCEAAPPATTAVKVIARSQHSWYVRARGDLQRPLPFVRWPGPRSTEACLLPLGSPGGGDLGRRILESLGASGRPCPADLKDGPYTSFLIRRHFGYNCLNVHVVPFRLRQCSRDVRLKVFEFGTGRGVEYWRRRERGGGGASCGCCCCSLCSWGARGCRCCRLCRWRFRLGESGDVAPLFRRGAGGVCRGWCGQEGG
jgi:hypothetical protein